MSPGCCEVCGRDQVIARPVEECQALLFDGLPVAYDVDDRSRAALLDRLLGELPDKQREALKMKYVEERDTQYIEQALQMSSSNVYTTISRAIQSLKDKIKTLKI